MIRRLLGILGRVYKDRWDDARKAGNLPLARAHLTNAIEAYATFFSSILRELESGKVIAFAGEVPFHLYFGIAEAMEQRGWRVHRSGGDDLTIDLLNAQGLESALPEVDAPHAGLLLCHEGPPDR